MTSRRIDFAHHRRRRGGGAKTTCHRAFPSQRTGLGRVLEGAPVAAVVYTSSRRWRHGSLPMARNARDARGPPPVLLHTAPQILSEEAGRVTPSVSNGLQKWPAVRRDLQTGQKATAFRRSPQSIIKNAMLGVPHLVGRGSGDDEHDVTPEH